jgi:hypothetical protein
VCYIEFGFAIMSLDIKFGFNSGLGIKFGFEFGFGY